LGHASLTTETSEPGLSNERKRAPEDVASGSQSAPRAHPRTGATIPGTERRPGQTGGRARGLNVSTASDPTPASRTKNYHTPTPFSSYRVSHKRHKRLVANSISPLRQPVPGLRTASSGSARPAPQPTSHRAGPRRAPPPSGHAAGAPWTDRCTGIVVTHNVGPLVHASSRSRRGPRTAGGTPRSPADPDWPVPAR
jgi:hypothetical protein